MSDIERRFHEHWLGLVQPAEGLVVSIPVLVDAQCAEKLSREAHDVFLEEVVEEGGALRVTDLAHLFESVLELPPSRFDEGEAIPKELSLFVPEGGQLLRPTRALRATEGATPPYLFLVWEVPHAIANLDKPEALTGEWEYPAQAKFERLLRECRVPLGLLSNGAELRLVYAPHGESSGWIAFRVADMASVAGRPIFDAFVMLLGKARWFAVAPERQLPALCAESRRRNVDVTNDLARQVFEALEVLLAGFAAAEERDGRGSLRAAIERGDEHLYAGLLSVLLRLVFLLYCEDRALLPVEHPLFAEGYSLLGLFEDLRNDQGRFPDTMHRRFGAYPRLVALFRSVYLGVKHEDLEIPARRGELFDCHVYSFLEGWDADVSAPIEDAEARAATAVPSVDDGTIFTVLDKLLYLGGQRLSYKSLDVEQIGSVYEALMGFDVERLTAPAVRIKLGSKKGAARVWVTGAELLAIPKTARVSHLQEHLGFDKATAAKVAEAVASAKTEAQALAGLEPLAGKRAGRGAERAEMGTLVLQPGPERRRTSSHYTPRELTEPIVARTLEPLLRAMGENPSSETLLNLVICDPAMGSGAFLVAACRFLADHVVAAWTREGKMHLIADAHDDVVNHARRLVAQRCLYGVDKNRYAVQLARMSLWLVTMARREPFTFVDHALRHGDSLVGLSFEQIRAFHWRPEAQVEASTVILKEALDEAVGIRQEILSLAGDGSEAAQKRKATLLLDAEDALERARLVGDLVIGAFFAHAKDKDRERERKDRLELIHRWLAADREGHWDDAARHLGALHAMQAELKKAQVPFHWMVEFPEVFFDERHDPLDNNRPGMAYVDAFVGNPPFLGGNRISIPNGAAYRDWLAQLFSTSSNTDLCAFFFRRAAELLGARGASGFIATNSVAQGDSRLAGLAWICARGGQIYDATTSLPWPGEASVSVSVAHFAMGLNPIGAILDGVPTAQISSFLTPRRREEAPMPLGANTGVSVIGSTVLGIGFVFDDRNPDATTLEEMRAIIARDPRNAERILKYVGGEDLNSTVNQSFERRIITFDEMTEEEARRWPELFSIVASKVRPARASVKQRDRREEWWRHATRSPSLRAYLDTFGRALATSRVTAHLAFSFVPRDVVLADTIVAILIHEFTGFAILQSRIHEPWARLLSSSLEDRLRYSASDCFQTFPFPHAAPRAVVPALESAGEALYGARSSFMVETNQGLTKTYNALKDPDSVDPRVLELRRLHEAMDCAVLDAYGWSDLAVPPYCPLSPEDNARQRAFEDAVIDRLFALNAERAAQEAKADGGAAAGARGKGKAARAKTATSAGAELEAEVAAAKTSAKAGRKKKDPGPSLPGMG